MIEQDASVVRDTLKFPHKPETQELRPPVRDEFKYRKILLNIDRNLLDRDLTALKFLCLDDFVGLRHGQLEKVTRGLDLFNKLELRGLLSKDKLDVLIKLLSLVGRIDMKILVETFYGVGNDVPVSPYRQMVLDIASDIGRQEFEIIRPFLKEYMSARTIEKVQDPVQMMIELEKLLVIRPTKVEFLIKIADYLQREDIIERLQLYQGKEGIKEHTEKPLAYSTPATAPGTTDLKPNQAGYYNISSSPSRNYGQTRSQTHHQYEHANRHTITGKPTQVVGRNENVYLYEKSGMQPEDHDVNLAILSDRQVQMTNERDTIQDVANGLGLEWKMLGYVLSMKASEMPNDKGPANMLTNWQLKTPHTDHLSTLCKALAHSKVGRRDLANIVEDKQVQLRSLYELPANKLVEQGTVQNNTITSIHKESQIAYTETAVLQLPFRKGLQDTYRMKSNPRGICLVINNMDFVTCSSLKERKGSEVDEDNLKCVFELLGFEVRVKRNANTEEMMQLCIQGSLMNHTAYDCFVCCILSHGDLGSIFGVDGKLIKIIDITRNFRPTNCPTLANKPKLFFIQACQGKRKAEKFNIDHFEKDDHDQGDIQETIPDDADFLIGYATAPGNVSYRSKSFGSWYITQLTKALTEFHKDEHLLDILTHVNSEVSKAIARESNNTYKQVPAPQYTLRKKLYL